MAGVEWYVRCGLKSVGGREQGLGVEGFGVGTCKALMMWASECESNAEVASSHKRILASCVPQV